MTQARASHAALSALAVFALGAGARAQSLPASAEVVLIECEDARFDVDAMLAILRLELANDGVAELRVVREAAPAEAVAVIALTECGAPAITITVDDNATGKRISRTIELAGAPGPSRPRVLALAIAELLRASWAELAIGDVPAMPPAIRERVLRRLAARGAVLDPPRSEPQDAPSLPERAREPIALSALGGVRAFTSGGLALLGGLVRVELPILDAFVLAIAAHAGWGRALHPWGAIELASAGGALEPRVRARLGALRVDLAAVLDVAWARAEGRTNVPGVIASGGEAPLVALGLAAEVSYALAGSLFAHVGVGAGATLAGVQATVDDAPIAGASGAYLSLQLGLGYAL